MAFIDVFPGDVYLKVGLKRGSWSKFYVDDEVGEDFTVTMRRLHASEGDEVTGTMTVPVTDLRDPAKWRLDHTNPHARASRGVDPAKLGEGYAA
jgi:hypothetical protein